jgi:hypothetical protein
MIKNHNYNRIKNDSYLRWCASRILEKIIFARSGYKGGISFVRCKDYNKKIHLKIDDENNLILYLEEKDVKLFKKIFK